MISDKVFKGNDIRGVYPSDIDNHFAERLGWAIADFLGYQGTVVVSGDARESTEPLKQSLLKGLTELGINVVDIGLGPTPMIYFTMANNHDFDLGIAITASHNPPEYNGFKVCNDKGVSLSYENFFWTIKDRMKMDKEKFISKSKKSYSKGKLIQRIDLQDEYFQFLKKELGSIEPINLAIEFGNGSAGRFRELFDFPVISLHEEPKGNFPHLNPDPTKEDSYTFIREQFNLEKSEIGIVFDGDGDRVGFMDEKGRIISPDKIVMMFHDFLEINGSPLIVLDVKMSKATKEYIENNNGKVLLSKVGHSYIQELVLEEKAALAGEFSCHYYFYDKYFGFDDGLYSAVRFLKIANEIKKNGKTVAEWIDQLPSYHSTPEYRIKMDKDKHPALIKELKEWAISEGCKILDIDGIRAEFDNGWFLVRSSNTEPKISYRMEANNEATLNSIEKKVKAIIAKYS